MRLRDNYNATVYACYTGYITQAIINNFAPLLFITFSSEFGLGLDRIALITTLNFAVQLFVDLISAKLIEKTGYRTAIVAAHVFAAAGLTALATLPYILTDAYVGILISVCCYAVGGGLTEVLISPIVVACPTEKKKTAISLLHSFYCWGHVAVILLSALYFRLFGIPAWRYMALLWATVPVVNTFVFTLVPINKLPGDEAGGKVRDLFRDPVFYVIMVVMVCAGAAEQGMSQWASAFAESSLHVSKTAGDLLGPCMFAILMGTSRALYGKFGEKIPLRRAMIFCGALCVGSYLLASLSGSAAAGLIGCGVCGFSVGIFWPGTFSTAAEKMPAAGTALYAFMALAGDVGCSAGPSLVGMLANAAGDDLRRGLIFAVVFPIVLIAGVAALGKMKNRTL